MIFHDGVPRGYEENLEWRVWLAEKARRSPRYQRLLRAMCKRDILFFINTFVFQVNPAKVGNEIGPFISWKFQDEALLETIKVCLGEVRDDMLWEKSRELGATWMAIILILWLCLFHTNKNVLCISHSEKAVSSSASDTTLFAKIQFILDHLPDWMNHGVKKWKDGYKFPGRCSITASATTERAGVGDRYSLVLLDEFSKQKDGGKIWGQTRDTGPRLVIGTHYGIGTTYYELTVRPDMHKKVMHWTMHPEKNRGMYRYNADTGKIDVIDKEFDYEAHKEKNTKWEFVYDVAPKGGPFPGIRSPYYDHECSRADNARDISMHLDIDPRGATSQFFDAVLIFQLKKEFTCPPIWQGNVMYDSDTGQPERLIADPNGPISLWFNPDDKGHVVPDLYAMGGDISHGTGATPTCFSIIRAKTGEKVCEYKDARLGPLAAGTLAVALCYIFRSDTGEGAKFCWEFNGPGVSFGQRIMELGYRNVYYRSNEYDMVKTVSSRPGWVANNTSIRETLEHYQNALRLRNCINRSWDALDECLSFEFASSGYVVHGGSVKTSDPSKARENHSDMVIADALAWKMVKSFGLNQKKTEEELTIPMSSLAFRVRMAEDSDEED